MSDLQLVGRFAGRVRAAVESAVIGKSDVVDRVIAAMLSKGHVLFEDFPGLGKTLLARSLAQSTGLEFRRIQFTPDLLPGDITGGYLFNRESGSFELRKGPIFTNVLLADEVNRASPKTQSALLEAMQEGQVTLDGRSFPLPEPFIVLATQNPIEYEGTFPLPEAQLDRFLVKLSIGYPDLESEVEILRRRRDRKHDQMTLEAVTERDEIVAMCELVEEVHLHEDLEAYIVRIVQRTRESSGISVGASPRGALSIMKMARSTAAMVGRGFVTPDDIKAVAMNALRHRIVLAPELWMRERAAEDLVASVVDAIPVPVINAQ